MLTSAVPVPAFYNLPLSAFATTVVEHTPCVCVHVCAWVGGCMLPANSHQMWAGEVCWNCCTDW